MWLIVQPYYEPRQSSLIQIIVAKSLANNIEIENNLFPTSEVDFFPFSWHCNWLTGFVQWVVVPCVWSEIVSAVCWGWLLSAVCGMMATAGLCVFLRPGSPMLLLLRCQRIQQRFCGYGLLVLWALVLGSRDREQQELVGGRDVPSIVCPSYRQAYTLTRRGHDVTTMVQ